MTIQLKQQIKEKLEAFIAQKGSQNKAATIVDVSPAMLSHIVNENWDKVSDDMWRKVSAKIGFKQNTWDIIETTAFVKITQFLTDSQNESNVFAIVAPAGSGKSVAQATYAANNENAFMLSCNEFWNRKYFLAELLTVMGKDYSGLTVAEMMHEAVAKLKSMQNPIIMLDEADKLPDQVLYFFITLYNRLEDYCGIVMIATDHLKKRIDKGIKLNKKGYQEIYSRIGRKFIELNGATYSDVVGICTTNGITDKKTVNEIWDDSESDLRRVKRKIHAIKSKPNEDKTSRNG